MGLGKLSFMRRSLSTFFVTFPSPFLGGIRVARVFITLNSGKVKGDKKGAIEATDFKGLALFHLFIYVETKG